MAEKKLSPSPGATVRLKGTDRIYTLLEVVTHYEGTDWRIDWGVLRPAPPASHTAHWPMSQLEPVEPPEALPSPPMRKPGLVTGLAVGEFDDADRGAPAPAPLILPGQRKMRQVEA